MPRLNAEQVKQLEAEVFTDNYRHAQRVRHFSSALAQLCANYRVTLVHEDGHGCAHIIPIREGEAAHCAIEIADYVLDESTRELFL